MTIRISSSSLTIPWMIPTSNPVTFAMTSRLPMRSLSSFRNVYCSLRSSLTVSTSSCTCPLETIHVSISLEAASKAPRCSAGIVWNAAATSASRTSSASLRSGVVNIPAVIATTSRALSGEIWASHAWTAAASTTRTSLPAGRRRVGRRDWNRGNGGTQGVCGHRSLGQRALEAAWREEFHRHGRAFHRSHALETLIDRGIPPCLRGQVWPLLLGNVLKVTPETFHLWAFHLPDSEVFASCGGGTTGSPRERGNGATDRRGLGADLRLTRQFFPRGADVWNDAVDAAGICVLPARRGVCAGDVVSRGDVGAAYSRPGGVFPVSGELAGGGAFVCLLFAEGGVGEG